MVTKMTATNSTKVLENIFKKTNSIFLIHAMNSELARKLGIGFNYKFDAENGFSYNAALLINDTEFAVIPSKYDPRKAMNLLDFDYKTLSEDDADDFISLLTTENSLANQIVTDWKKYFDEHIRIIFDSLCDQKKISDAEAFELIEEVRDILDELYTKHTEKVNKMNLNFAKMTTDLDKFLNTL